MDKTANDKTANAHASSPESMVLELVIQPTIGELNQVDRMCFGYNELTRQGDWDERIAYLQKEIGAKHPRLEVTDAQATVDLRNVLRGWHPGLASQGRFTIQIRGALGSKDADAAQAAPSSAALQKATLDAERIAAEEREKARRAEDAHKRDLADQEEKAKEQQRRADAELLQAKQQRDDLQHRWEQAREELGQRETELLAHQHEQSAAAPSEDAELRAVIYELEMRSQSYEEQLTSANATIARLKGTATSSTPANNAPSWQVEQASPPPGQDTRTDTDGHDTGPQYPDDKLGPLE